MAKVLIWGTRDGAQLANFYLKNDSEHEVIGFTVDGAYLESATFDGLPVFAFEEVLTNFPPDQYQMFIPMSQSRVNKDRAEKYQQVKACGYQLISYISSKATYYNTPVGDNCFIFENNVIQPFTKIGNNVTLWSGNHIGHHSTIGDHCFISSHVVVSGHVDVGDYCFLGVNSTIRNGIKIGPRSYIGAGAFINQDTVESGVYPGSQSVLSKVPSHKIKF